MSSSSDYNKDQTAAENLLYQRIIIFLIVFSVVILAAVNAQRKILFLSILFLGLIICAVLTLIIIRTAKQVDNKSGFKIVRLILGFVIPVFCLLMLITFLTAGSLGFVDPYLFPAEFKQVQLENKLNKIKDDVLKKISPPEKKTGDNFKDVDSVIAEGNRVAQTGNPLENNPVKSKTSKTAISKQTVDSRYFKAIDSVIVSNKPADNKTNTAKPFLPPAKRSKGAKNLKTIDSVLYKEK